MHISPYYRTFDPSLRSVTRGFLSKRLSITTGQDHESGDKRPGLLQHFILLEISVSYRMNHVMHHVCIPSLNLTSIIWGRIYIGSIWYLVAGVDD